MKITEIINGKDRSLSFEVFPPKTSDKYDSVSEAVKEIAMLSPSYMSVTYGAGGGTSEYTARIAAELNSLGVNSISHLTCISSTKECVQNQLEILKSIGVENILALRGDIPDNHNIDKLDFHYAYELIDEIRSQGDFCIGGACYPECHPESKSIIDDINYLKLKVEHGCDFLTTQMFFENEIFYRFIDRLYDNGIHVPVIPGIMPITAYSQVERMVKLSGNKLPDSFSAMIEKYKESPDDLKKAGVEYAILQARDIYEKGFRAVHIYSMNKPDVAREIKNSLKDLL